MPIEGGMTLSITITNASLNMMTLEEENNSRRGRLSTIYLLIKLHF
jgi:hypothetical protein